MKSKQLITEKSKKTIFKDFFSAVFIILISFLPYLHDFDMFKGVKGFSGFSSLRIGIWVVSLFLLGLSGWVVAFINSKGKKYRFIMLCPIFMITFQLGIYLLDARNTQTNDFSFKIILNFILAFVLVVTYFYGIKKSVK